MVGMGRQYEISGSRASRVGDEVGGMRRACGEEPDGGRRVPARLGDMGTVELAQGNGTGTLRGHLLWRSSI